MRSGGNPACSRGMELVQGSRLCECFRVTRHMDGRPCIPLSAPFDISLGPICLTLDHETSTRSGLLSMAFSRRIENWSGRRALKGLGTEGDTPAHRAGMPLRIHLPVLRGLPESRGRCRAWLRDGQRPRDEPPSPGDRRAGFLGQACSLRPRPSGLARVQETGDPRQRLPAPAATAQCGAEPCRDAVLGPETSPFRQPRVRKRRACQGGRREGVERVHPQDSRVLAGHRKSLGRAAKCRLASFRECNNFV